MKSVEEVANCAVTQSTYGRIFGEKVGAASAGAGDDGGEDEGLSGDSDSDAEAAGATKTAKPVPTERHLFPWSAPEMFYRNAIRAFQPPMDLVSPRMKVIDLRPGAGLACLAAVRDGFAYHCFACTEQHRAWLFQHTVLSILTELVLGTSTAFEAKRKRPCAAKCR